MVRLTDRPDMVLDVFVDIKQQHNNNTTTTDKAADNETTRLGLLGLHCLPFIV